ncbi:hypothetical protein ACHAQA_005620 [Verticillium albo-atrum]
MRRKGYMTLGGGKDSADRKMEKKTLPPFPARQMFVLALCRICEPIAFMSIFPYIYYMIEDFNITDDKNKISVYAGMVTSAFTLAEFSTGLMWGRLSDKIGRKPVLLTGLAGTALSVLLFGFAPNLPVALFARALGGLLNGYPNIFLPGTIWEKYPYLLPNLFSAAAVCCGVIIGLLFLEETHPERKHRRDAGVELGKRITSWMSSNNCQLTARRAEKQALLEEEQLPGYRTSENSPQLSTTSAPELSDSLDLNAPSSSASDAGSEMKSKIFTKPVVLNIISYGILAFHTMTFDQLFPVFLSTKSPAEKDFHLPFKFVDGFGMETKEIGVILSVQGVYSMISTVFLFPLVTRRLGALRLFRFMALSYFALYLTTPYLVLLPENFRMAGIYLMVIWKCTFSTMAYPANAILLTNSAPNLTTLGTINGVAASTASLCRAFGPTISGFLYAMGLETGYSGLAWWTSAAITIVGAFLSLQITETRSRLDVPVDDVETAVEPTEREALLVDFDEDEDEDLSKP